MGSGQFGWDDDDDGLPDAAFTEDELDAGVQHIMRTGNPNATSSGRSKSLSWTADEGGGESTQQSGNRLSSSSGASLRFETFAQARAWAQANPGGAFKRATDGRGFEIKPTPHSRSVNLKQPEVGSNWDRSTEIKSMAPHLHDVLANSAGSYRSISMRPFYRSTWEAELGRLSTAKLRRLRLLVSVHLEESRMYLRDIYDQTRRSHRMKAGHYGEELHERTNEIMEGALEDIDKCLVANRSGD